MDELELFKLGRGVFLGSLATWIVLAVAIPSPSPSQQDLFKLLHWIVSGSFGFLFGSFKTRKAKKDKKDKKKNKQLISGPTQQATQKSPLTGKAAVAQMEARNGSADTEKGATDAGPEDEDAEESEPPQAFAAEGDVSAQ